MGTDSYYNRGGGASGDQSGGSGGGGGDDQSQGYGESGTLLFRYELYSDAAHSDFVSQSGYDYATREEASAAGLAAATQAARYVRVTANKTGFGVSDTELPPTGDSHPTDPNWPGPGWEWSPRYGKYIKISDYVWDSVLQDWVPAGTATPPPAPPGTPPGPGDLPGLDNNWMVYLVIAIVIIAIIALGLKGGS